jgi:metal-dependent hydrolase (beta-lactamase superfamily II)
VHERVYAPKILLLRIDKSCDNYYVIYQQQEEEKKRKQREEEERKNKLHEKLDKEKILGELEEKNAEEKSDNVKVKKSKRKSSESAENVVATKKKSGMYLIWNCTNFVWNKCCDKLSC